MATVFGKQDPCDLNEATNFAIAVSYFSIGLVSSFLSTPLNIYLVEVLDAEPAMQNTISILSTLPWSLKLVFGFLSDAFPIFGMHRKPYLIAGCLIYSFSFILYALLDEHNTTTLAFVVFFGTLGLIMLDVMTDTLCVERSKFEREEYRGQMQASCYSIRFAGCCIGAMLGTVVSNKDVPGMSWVYLDFQKVSFVNGIIPFVLVVPWLYQLKEVYVPRPTIGEKDKPAVSIEMGPVSSGKKETKLSAVASGRSSYGSVDGVSHVPLNLVAKKVQQGGLSNDNNKNLISTAAHSSTRYAPLVSSDPFYSEVLVSAEEEEEREEREILRGMRAHSSVSSQVNEIWLTVQLQAVWRPMAFVYLFNLFQIPNVAWQSYLQLTLHFEPWILGLTVFLGSLMTFAGIMAYKFYFFKASWRLIYLYSAVLTSFFSLLQLVLIFQLNTKIGVSNYFFSMGDDVISAYISGIQFLPVCIMYMRLCPEGAEGSSYAMLTTFGNIALVCASSFGNSFAQLWDVSNDTLRKGDISGLWRLNTLTSLCSLLPLSLLFLLPRDSAEQDELSKSKVRSALGGVVFLSVLFISLGWTISQAVLDILRG